MGCQSAQTAPAGQDSDLGMRRDELNHLLYSRLHPSAALRRPLIDVRKRLAQVLEGANSIADRHKPYFAQTARTSSSVANSRRSTCAKNLSKERSSFYVIAMTGGASSVVSCEQQPRDLLLRLGGQIAYALYGFLDEGAHTTNIVEAEAIVRRISRCPGSERHERSGRVCSRGR